MSRGNVVGSVSPGVLRQLPIPEATASRPMPCETPSSPASSPANTRRFRPSFRPYPRHRISSLFRRIDRRKLMPQLPPPGTKFRVRKGIRISADHPSGRRAVRTSQIPSQERLTPPNPPPPPGPPPPVPVMSPSLRAPAAFVSKW